MSHYAESPPEPDDRSLFDMADAIFRKQPRWACPYCGQDVPESWTPHCGEAHGAIPMEDE